MNATTLLQADTRVAASVSGWQRLRSWSSDRRRTARRTRPLDLQVCRDRHLLQDMGLLWCDVAYGSSGVPGDTGF